MFNVDKILKAEKRKGVWWIRVKWEGWSEPTEERRKDLLEDCTPAVRKLVLEECAHAVTRRRTVEIEDEDEFTFSASSDDNEGARDGEATGEFLVREGTQNSGPCPSLSMSFADLIAGTRVEDQPSDWTELKLAMATVQLQVEAIMLMM